MELVPYCNHCKCHVMVSALWKCVFCNSEIDWEKQGKTDDKKEPKDAPR